MASIIKVKGRWRVQIRRKGHQPITETRPWSKAEAQRWAMEIEIALGKGQSACAVLARGVTIAQLIDKYRELRDRARPILDTSNEHGNHVVLVRDRKHPRRKKGNDERVPLTDTAWAILQKQTGDDVRVFPIHPQTLSKYVTDACKALAIPDLHLHDMRHEGTSRLFEQGFSVPELALFTGHKDWQNLSRYTQLKPEQVRKS